MKIGFLGPSGTFCQEALEIYLREIGGGDSIEFPTIYDALNAACTGEIECAVVPIENSIEGSINSTLDILAENEKLKICAEITLNIKHSLLVKYSTSLEEVELVLSHPQAIAQCSKFLRERLPGVSVRNCTSTAEAAREVAGSEQKWASISNSKTAELYGLKIAENSIQDEKNNVTRFAVVSVNEAQKTGRDKTSIAFSAEDRPGSLYRILDIFNLWDINLTKIESRPAKNELGKYIFFVDFVGHYTDQDVRDAMTMINRKTSFFRLIGSYPKVN